MIGKQFSFFLSVTDEIVFLKQLTKLENVVFIKPSFSNEEHFTIENPVNRHRDLKNRRMLISSSEFIGDLVIDKFNNSSVVNSSISPVIEYDINLTIGNKEFPGRMYYIDNNYVNTENRVMYIKYFNHIFLYSKSILNKRKNKYGSIVYLGNEKLAELESGSSDFRLI